VKRKPFSIVLLRWKIAHLFIRYVYHIYSKLRSNGPLAPLQAPGMNVDNSRSLEWMKRETAFFAWWTNHSSFRANLILLFFCRLNGDKRHQLIILLNKPEITPKYRIYYQCRYRCRWNKPVPVQWENALQIIQN
jgi:hypothetical protein